MEFPKRGCLALLLLVAIATLTLALFIGCGKRAAGPPTAEGQPLVEEPAPAQGDDSGILPSVFNLDSCITVTRGVSQDETVTSLGFEAYINDQTGTNGGSGLNVEVDATALTLRAYEPGEYAYAVYGQAIGIDPKPLQTLIASEVCDYGGGRDDDIPLVYYVGLADYSIGSWRWFGPFGDVDVVVTVNSEALKSRFKSSANNFYLCVLASNGSKAVNAIPAEGLVAGFPVDISARAVSQDKEDPGGLTIQEIVTLTGEGLATDPALVTGLKATADVGGVSVDWHSNPDPDVFLYQVQRSDLPPPSVLETVGAEKTECRDETGTPGKGYEYRVRARNDAGWGGQSAVRIARELSAPTVTASDGLSADYVRVAWTAVEGAAGYAVLRADAADSTPAELGRVSESALSYDDSTGVLGQAYYYWVQALGADIDGPLGGPDGGLRMELAPVQANATDGDYPDKVAITWGAEPLAEAYNLYRNLTDEESGAELLDSLPAAQTVFEDATASWETVYYYFVKPVIGTELPRGASDTGYRGLATPQSPAATQGVYVDKVLVSWPAVNNATRYRVYRGGSPVDPAPVYRGQAGAPARSYQDDAPGWASGEGTHYYYFVTALYAGPDTEASVRSTAAEGWRGLGIPTGISASDGTFTDKVLVSWSQVSQATGYRAYRADSDTGAPTQMWSVTGQTTTSHQDVTAAVNVQYWYFVAAVRGTEEGKASSRDTGTRGNYSPVAQLAADPAAGDAPLTADFDASASYDTDGSIVKYEWDWTNDGTYDLDSGADPTVSREYTTAGQYTCNVRVTDNYGATSVGTVALNAYLAEWVHTWGGSGDEAIYGVVVDSGGYCYGAGYTFSYGQGLSDVLAVKYDPNGNCVWRKIWGGTAHDGAHDLALSPDGFLYIVASTMSFGAGDQDFALMKYTLSGTLLWVKTWGGTGYDVPYMMDIDDNGDIYIGGSQNSFGAGSYDQIILKYSSSGNLLWQRTWGGSDHENAEALTVDKDGYVYATGLTFSYGAGYYDVLVTKFTPSGDFLWARTWGGGSAERSMGVGTDADGYLYVSGYTGSFSTGSNAYLLKYSPAGDLIWERAWGGDESDYGYCLDVDPTGNAIIGCQISYQSSGFSDLAVISYSTSGELLWQRLWDSSDQDIPNPNGIRFGAGGKAYVGGSSFDATGIWTNPGWESVPISGTVSSPNGTVTTPSGTQTSPTGTESEPTGITDSGGGDYDQLIMKLDPSGL